MAERAAAQASEWDTEVQAPLIPDVSFMKETQLQTAAISLWTVVAAVQAVERKVEAHAMRLLNLERRSGAAEKKFVDCEKTVVEFGNQLESKWAVLGTLIQEYGLLQRKLENMENLLKNRNFWILRIPPANKGEDPKVPVAFDDVSIQIPREKWENLEEWQKELYKNVMKGNYESLISLDHAISKPDILSRLEQGEEFCAGEMQDLEVREIPTESTTDVIHDFPPAPGTSVSTGPSTESPISTTDIMSWIKQEEEQSTRAQENAKEQETHRSTSTNDRILIKHEERPEERGPVTQEPPVTLSGRSEACIFQAPEWDTESWWPMSLQPPAVPEETSLRETQLQRAEISLTVVAEVQAVERKVDSQAAQLLNLDGRMGTAEKKLVGCEKTMVEFGNQLESKWAALGTLIQEYGLLQRRLENMENLLKNRNFWILRLPPGTKGEVPQGWESAAKWQKELCENVMKGNFETLISMDSAISKPSILSWIEGEEEPCTGDEPEETEIPMEPSMDSPVPTHEISSWIKQEEELCIKDQQDSEEREIPADLRMDVELTIKTEEQPPEEGPSNREPPGPWPGRAEERAFQGAEQEAAVGSPGTSISSPGNNLGELTQHERELRSVAAHPRGDAGIAPYACAQCGRNFTRKDVLLSHERLHTGERPYTCADCGKSFSLKISFVKHQRCHTKERPHPCNECQKSFKCHSALVRHQMIHRGERPYKCDQCNKSYSRKEHLQNHQRLHTGERPFHCATCGKSFSQKFVLVSHQRIHTGEWPYKCTECGKGFSEKSKLTSHYRIHTGEKPYSCAQCGKSFRLKVSFLRHQTSHGSEKPYPCTQCGKNYSYHSGLLRHQLIHAGQRPHQCNKCGKSYAEKYRLRNHQRVHLDEGPQRCVPCGKSASEKQDLLSHQQSHADGRHQHTMCEQSVWLVESGLKHQRNHSKEKPYKCIDCGKSFKCQSELTRHRRVHTGERPYECTKCDKSYSQKYHLLQHLRVHTGERPHQCSDCGKSFIRKEHLLKHQRIHTGGRPHQCSECGRSFHYKQLLKDHQKVHNAEPDHLEASPRTEA
ncbi:zinc finger protein 282-like isoform X2 [Mauremys mutica]|uniref:zinc finger protein 282-like isoform X2 n=1 Tax=Mauremys mutica TaxID=74926 RepID=UPI001D167F4F|nr:zinc finger protein 282-like isoform X2 [Mauremys mutica]